MRFVKFSAVGMAGVAVQLGALWALAHALPAVVATLFAVEIALLHNFLWHEVWTWRGLPPAARWTRLLRFHASNGLISLASNALFTWLFHQYWTLPLLAANLAAIGITAILNFALADLWVFRRGEVA
jgi:putative flippase GtrA